jgi:hypothetical protein
MKTLLAVALGATPLLAIGVALAQNGSTMNANDGLWGGGWTSGYGGIAVSMLLAIAVAGLVALFVQRRGK